MVRQNIKELSQKLLDDAEWDEANSVIIGIAKGDSEAALSSLANVLGMKPKRPLYYIAHEISLLPEYGSRNIVRYCGDYIDQLVRFTLEDKRYMSRWFLHPLGSNVRKLKSLSILISLKYFTHITRFTFRRSMSSIIVRMRVFFHILMRFMWSILLGVSRGDY